jgi:hypothetical protein
LRTRRFVIRPIIALALGFIAAPLAVRADFVTYQMSGTIQIARNTTMPIAVGDPISWTLRYNRSSGLATSPDGGYTNSQVGPLISNIVDGRNGFRIYTPTSVPAGIIVSQGSFMTTDFQFSVYTPGTNYDAGLLLSSIAPLPTMNLADLQLDHIPFHLENTYPSLSNFAYRDPGARDFSGFIADVTSLSAASTPEPGAFALSVLGASGLVARHFRRRIGRRRGSCWHEKE